MLSLNLGELIKTMDFRSSYQHTSSKDIPYNNGDSSFAMSGANQMRNKNRKVPKLRTSCDACSSAKVRCTQTKPTCSRCAKHGITCVYGISRRSGKRSADSYKAMKQSEEKEVVQSIEMDMERSISPFPMQSIKHRTPSFSFMNMPCNSLSNHSSSTSTPPSATYSNMPNSPVFMEFAESNSGDSEESLSQDQYPASPDSCPDLPDYIKSQLKDWAMANPFIPNILPTPQDSPRLSPFSNFFDFQNREPHLASQEFVKPAQCHVEEIPRYYKSSSVYSDSTEAEEEYSGFNSSAEDFPETIVPSVEPEHSFERTPRPQPTRTQTDTSILSCASSSKPRLANLKPCRCSETIIAHLSPRIDGGASYDQLLAHLRDSLKLGSEVLNCTYTTSDPSIALSLSLLAARIVTVLESLCRLSREEECEETCQMNAYGDHFSLGMYEVADEDEKRLKQEMLGLQIKKAEVLVLCSRNLVGRSSMAIDTQSVVSDKLFSFLGNQIGEVRKEWNARRSVF